MRVVWTSLALQAYKNIHNNTGQQLTSWANLLILRPSLITFFEAEQAVPDCPDYLCQWRGHCVIIKNDIMSLHVTSLRGQWWPHFYWISNRVLMKNCTNLFLTKNCYFGKLAWNHKKNRTLSSILDSSKQHFARCHSHANCTKILWNWESKENTKAYTKRSNGRYTCIFMCINAVARVWLIYFIFLQILKRSRILSFIYWVTLLVMSLVHTSLAMVDFWPINYSELN